MYRIFIVEDDRGIAEQIGRKAQMWNMDYRAAEDLRAVTAEFKAYQPHIVLLDIGLPVFSGYYWCGEIRRISDVPILFLSSASDNLNIVTAMHMGADDFIAKPFDSAVLIAKIQALLRRSYDMNASVSILEHRGAVLNSEDGTVSYQGAQIPLSRNEYRILLCLMENKGKVVSRERLMERLWQTQQFVDENTLTVNVNRLRKKLDTAGLPDFITTKIGAGYSIGG